MGTYTTRYDAELLAQVKQVQEALSLLGNDLDLLADGFHENDPILGLVNRIEISFRLMDFRVGMLRSEVQRHQR